jgi:uncharacterized membrane protein (DUF485 family)
MSTQPPQDDPRHIWQSHGPNPPSMSPRGFHVRLRMLQSKSKRHSVRSVLIGLVVLAIFAVVLARTQAPLERFALALFILGTLTIMCPHVLTLWRGAQVANREPDIAMTPGIDYYRRLLEPQRAYDSWTAVFLLLMFFGVLLVLLPMVSKQIEDPNSRVSIRSILPFSILMIGWAISFIFMRRRQQRWIRRELELLSILEKENR